VFRFQHKDGASGRHKTVSQILHLVLCIGFSVLGFLASFVAKNVTSIFILVPRLRFIYHKFCCIFSRYLPSKVWSHSYSCSYTPTEMGCLVTDDSIFCGTKERMWLSTDFRTERDPSFEMLCSLAFRTPNVEWGQKPANSTGFDVEHRTFASDIFWG
jgi:uncharacterized membrane protein YbhN (UPF0104 family)